MNAQDRARRHEHEFRVYLKLMREGLQNSSIAQFKDEMSLLADHATHPSIRESARKAVSRYDDLEGTANQNPFPAAVRAANSV